MGAFDHAVLRYFNQPGLPWLDLLMTGLSSAVLVVLLLAFSAAWMAPRKARGAEGIAALAASVAFSLALGTAVSQQHAARGRPCAQPGLVQTVAACPPGASLPSNHAAAAAAAAIAVAWVAPPAGVLAGGVALAVGMSRLYLGLNFPSDVAAGFGIGIFAALAACAIVTRIGIRRLLPAYARARNYR